MSETNRMPPQNQEAEQSLLGSLLIDQEAANKIVDRIARDDFYRPANEKVYDAMLHLYNRHEPIDILSAGNRLDEQGDLQSSNCLSC
ncbi:MAG: hypothetical protein O2877_01470 [bacterium]|nr:hypothetical protein [bacterium]